MKVLQIIFLITVLLVSGCGDEKLSSINFDKAIIRNNTSWVDTEGRQIEAHDGGISRFGKKFYWYGSSYAGNPTGLYGKKHKDKTNGFNVYSSYDLTNWEYEGVALEVPESGWGSGGSSHRAHVIYNKATRKYVMWFFHYTKSYPRVMATVAVADKPAGPFEIVGRRKTAAPNGYAQDLNVFQDEDGKGYLLYDDGKRNIRIDLLTEDYLFCTPETVIALAAMQEAPAMAKYRGKYIVAGSGVEGWLGTDTHYAVADHPLGPYCEKKLMSQSRTWDSQITDFVYISESDTLLAMCDVWWSPDKEDLNKSRYLWLPVTLEPERNYAQMHYVSEWQPFESQSSK